jgi:hypothetical protein
LKTFITAYTNRPKKFKGEINSGVKEVVTAGHMTVQQKVNQLKMAGAKLELYRNEQFDGDSNVKASDIMKNELRGLELLDGMQKTKQVEQFLINRKKTIETQIKNETLRIENEEKNLEKRALEADKIAEIRAKNQKKKDDLEQIKNKIKKDDGVI